MRIVILDGYTENPGDLSWEGFAKQGELTVYDRTPSSEPAEIIRRAKGAEAVILNKTVITEEVLEGLAPELRYIGVLATGYNVVDVAAARKRGVTVTNIPDYGTAAVAQFTMALLLELCHRVGAHSRSAKKDWPDSVDFCYWNTPLTELAGKTFGIIGYGRIGKAAARLASAFGMHILAYTPHPAADGFAEMVSLDELYARSDVISLHCPLFPETKELICRESLAKMKDGVWILNTSRGQLIAEADLAEALRSGKVGGAAADVLSSEPPRADNPLLSAENCLITPHIAWASRESRQRLMDTAVENLAAFCRGTPQNTVGA